MQCKTLKREKIVSHRIYGAFYRRNLCSPVDEKEMRKAHKRTRAQWNNGEKLLSIHNENWNWSHFSQWIDSEICERTNEVFLDCQNETQSCMPCTHVSRFIWFNVSFFPLLLLHSALVCCWKLLDFETTIHRVLANGSSRGGNGTSNSQNRNDNKRKWNFNFILLFSLSFLSLFRCFEIFFHATMNIKLMLRCLQRRETSTRRDNNSNN